LNEADARRVIERTIALYHDFVKEGSLAGAHLIGGLLGKSNAEVNEDLDSFQKEAAKRARF
jgi:hypothetical protein